MSNPYMVKNSSNSNDPAGSANLFNSNHDNKVPSPLPRTMKSTELASQALPTSTSSQTYSLAASTANRGQFWSRSTR